MRSGKTPPLQLKHEAPSSYKVFIFPAGVCVWSLLQVLTL